MSDSIPRGIHACILADLSDVSRPFEDSVSSALRKPRVSDRDHKGKLVIRVSYHTPRDLYNHTNKAAVVGKLVIQLKERLKIESVVEARDVEDAKRFLQSEEGSIWMSTWFEPRNQNYQDPTKQHWLLVADRLQTLQPVQTMALPSFASWSSPTGPLGMVCLDTRCGRGLVCHSSRQGYPKLVPTATYTAIQEPTQVSRRHVRKGQIQRNFAGPGIILGLLLVAFVGIVVISVHMLDLGGV